MDWQKYFCLKLLLFSWPPKCLMQAVPPIACLIMNPRHLFLAIIVAVVSMCTVFNASGERSRMGVEEYRGFRVDYSEVPRDTNYANLHAAMNRQIDIVLAVGVPDKMREFFQGVLIKV